QTVLIWPFGHLMARRISFYSLWMPQFPFNLETSVGQGEVYGFCELSPYGEMPALSHLGCMATRNDAKWSFHFNKLQLPCN
ncbi:hypothetical protein, partial [Streptobacillus moniliformis]|uniref:hypothetical protein n=1 Tax=Streptobacillus moniliformis TaxID=34105 RepID=UPI001E54A6C9